MSDATEGSGVQWPESALKELVDLRGITYGVVQPGQPTPGGVPILRVNNFTGSGLRLDDVLRIDPSVAAAHQRSRLRGGEVLITLVGTTGLVALAPQEVAGWNVARAVGVIPLRSEVPARWVAWYLQSPASRRFFDARLNTTVQKTLNLRDLAALTVPMPPRREIEAITNVLGALDDKIASNQRISALLEDTAVTLFRARFVDFVGVTEFDDRAGCRVPSGWTVGSLVDLAQFVNGKAFTKHANGDGRPILRIRELNGGVDAQTLRTTIEATPSNVAVTDDILFAWSGSLGVYRWPGEESLINQHIFKVIPTDVPPWFVWLWIETHMPAFKAIAAEKATTMGHIQRRHLVEAQVAVPQREVLNAADAAIGPIDRHRASLIQEQGTLTRIRDTLLPKLISGEIRVPVSADAAEVIEPMAKELSVP